MKRKYIKPESKLIVLNIKESIAASGGISEIGGAAVIQFSSSMDGCRMLYTDMLPVMTYENDFMNYYDDLMRQVEQTGKYEAYFRCFRRR